MNPNYGYQLYQAQRIKIRAEVLADDARNGRQAAAISRGSRALAAKVRASAVTALNAVAGIRARAATRAI
jgi:hypothetical protein